MARAGLAGLFCALILAACVGPEGNNDAVRVVDSAGGATTAAAAGPLGDDQIRSALAGKSFQYTRPDGNGLITFHPDGTSELQDDVKGTMSGSWRAAGGQLCEAFNPSEAMPEGRPEACAPFSNTGDAYYAGKSRFAAI